MHIETVRDALNAGPFVPFTIYMADGQSYFIDHPDFLTLSRGGRTLIVNTAGERWALLETGLISRLEVEKAPVDA